MLFDHLCRHCQSSHLDRSSIHNPLEAVLSPIITIYRCKSCQQRQGKLRSVKIGRDRPAEKNTYGLRLKRF